MLAWLEPVVERVSSTSSSSTHSTFGSRLSGAGFGMDQWCTGKMKNNRLVDKQIRIWAPLPNTEGKMAGLRKVSSVFLYLVLRLKSLSFLDS